MTTEQLLELAREYADVTTDSRGRISIEFDDHGLCAFEARIRADRWQPIETAPYNMRVIVQNADEMAMGWLDRVDGRWYYSPQGGLMPWAPAEWLHIPEGADAAGGGRNG